MKNIIILSNKNLLLNIKNNNTIVYNDVFKFLNDIKLKKINFDILICDEKLKGLDGLSTIAYLRLNKETNNKNIILISENINLIKKISKSFFIKTFIKYTNIDKLIKSINLISN